MRRIFYDPNSRKQILKFPQEVQIRLIAALEMEASGVRNPRTKTLSGFGNAQVCEIREWSEEGTYRVIFTLQVADRLYVIHAFQKKSKQGSETSKKDKQLIEQRLKRLSI